MRSSSKVVIDGTMAKSGGGYTYLVNVIPELSRQAPDTQFRVLVADRGVAAALPQLPNIEIDFVGQLGIKERLAFIYRKAGKLAREWGADLYFSAGEMAPVDAGCPTIAAFRNPNVFTLGKGQGFPLYQRVRLAMLNALARVSAHACDRIMFVSEDSADWIGKSVSLDERKRAVVHHGIDRKRWRARDASRLHGSSYILSVGSVYPYKNYVRLIEAYCMLAERKPETPDLVIIGDDQSAATTAKMEEARAASGAIGERIHLLGEVPYEDIARYYQDAELFVMPSFLETFGHPLIEAMASGVPLVAADIPVFHEIARDAAFYADPFDVRSLCGAMDAALFERGAAEILAKRGRERARDFSWTQTTQQLLEMFGELLPADAPLAAPAPDYVALPLPGRAGSIPVAGLAHPLRGH